MGRLDRFSAWKRELAKKRLRAEEIGLGGIGEISLLRSLSPKASPKGKAAAAAPTAKPAAATCDVCFGEGALVRCSTCAYAVHAARGNIQPEYAALFDDDWR